MMEFEEISIYPIKEAIKPKFELGDTVITPGAIAALEEAKETALPYMKRHHTGDWGDLCEEDKKSNNQALNPADPQRIFSSYILSNGTKLWIITEWNRSYTTILLPDDY